MRTSRRSSRQNSRLRRTVPRHTGNVPLASAPKPESPERARKPPSSPLAFGAAPGGGGAVLGPVAKVTVGRWRPRQRPGSRHSMLSSATQRQPGEETTPMSNPKMQRRPVEIEALEIQKETLQDLS